MTDSIADMLTRIRNAYLARKKSANVPHSLIKENIAKILTQEGYIKSFSVKKGKVQKVIEIQLEYKGKNPAVDGIDRISKPGRRIYTRADKIPLSLGGYGIMILSTNKGLMTGKKARKEKVGGEIICKVW